MPRAREWLAQRELDLTGGESADIFLANLETELDDEFTRWAQEKRALSEHISEVVIQSSRAHELQKENVSLRQQVAQLQRQSERDLGASAEYKALQQKCNSLEEDVVEYNKALAHMTETCRRLKDTIRQWEEYKAHKDRKAARAASRVEPHTTYGGLETPHGGDGLNANSPTPCVSPSSLAMQPSYKLKDLEDFALLGNAYSDAASDPGLREAGIKVADGLNELSAVAQVQTQVESTEHTRGTFQEAHTMSTIPSGVDLIRSSQSTEDETPSKQPACILTGDNDMDEPLFISARPVNHPRQRNEKPVPKPIRPQENQGTEPSDAVVKRERDASPDLTEVWPTKRQFTRTLTMDLDEPGIHVDTPRKRMRYTNPTDPRRLVTRNMTQNYSVRSTSMPLPSNRGSLAEADLIDGGSLVLKKSNSASPAPEERIRRDSSSSDAMSEDKGAVGSATNDGTLLPISPNQQIVPRTNPSSIARRARRSSGRAAKAIHLVSEDGESHLQSSRRSRKPRNSSAPRNVEGDRRLNRLLEGDLPPKERQVLDIPSTPSRRTVRRKAAAAVVRPSPGSSTPQSKSSHPGDAIHASPAVKDEERSAPTTVVKAKHTPRPPHSQQQAEQDDPPLRSRPPDELTLEDFKPNPDYIGHHLALDVVRDRDTRRCLPGCTRPCCTAAFRALVDAGARPTLPHGIAPASQSEDEEDGEARSGPQSPTSASPMARLSASERRLLQHHLGASYSRERVGRMRGAALEELLASARARLLADRHGRCHRRVWERARSPPGFWRADMPTTQEEEADRGQAAGMLRDTVRERWEDARRGGGRWAFRDE